LHLQAADVVYPTTEEEIVAAVATAVKNNQKIKVATKYSHSFPRFACPGSSSGVIISTKDYSSIVSVDTSAMTVTAQSGILMRVLTFAIADSNLALPYSPYWDALTLGGVLATGAHGSSHFGKGSAVHEYVVGVRVVVPANASEGYAKVVTFNVQDEDLNAVKVSLGVLGVISTVTLQLQPAFKRNLTLEVCDDAGLEDKILEIANTVEFGDVTWFASTHQVIYRIDHRVPNSTLGDGVNRFFGFQPLLGLEIEAIRTSGESNHNP
jgi:L-gulonolactone oxidase